VVSELVFLPACTLHDTLMILGDGTHITYRRRRYRGAENIFQSESEGEEDMGDKNEQPEDIALHILNNLARTQNELARVQSNMERGQQQMVELLNQLVANTQGTNGSQGNNGNHVEGSHTHVPTRIHIGSTSRMTPRPHMPQFLEGQPSEKSRAEGTRGGFYGVFEGVSDSRGGVSGSHVFAGFLYYQVQE
jgi:hypothetical protein